VAVALISPLAYEPPYVEECVHKKTKKDKTKLNAIEIAEMKVEQTITK